MVTDSSKNLVLSYCKYVIHNKSLSFMWLFTAEMRRLSCLRRSLRISTLRKSKHQKLVCLTNSWKETNIDVKFSGNIQVNFLSRAKIREKIFPHFFFLIKSDFKSNA